MEADNSDNEDSSNYNAISTLDTFKTLLDNINQNTELNQINLSLDEEKNSIKDDLLENESSSNETCNCDPIYIYIYILLILHRFTDLLVLIFLVLDAVLYFLANIFRIIEYIISYYSVIIMNYVFFISSIISYSMAPIYKSLSGDWLNSVISFLQVILASPLIAFYIVYIIKSIKSLGEFVTNTPSVINNFIKMFRIQYKGDFLDFISTFTKSDYKHIFIWESSKIIMFNFLRTLFIFGFFTALGYVLFCIDKCIIIVGIFCYVFNTIQIFLLIAPSYVYLFHTLFHIKCKRFRYVNAMIKYYKSFELDDSDSGNENEKNKNKKTDDFDNENEKNKYKKTDDSDTDNENEEKLIKKTDESDSLSDKSESKLIVIFHNLLNKVRDLFREQDENDEKIVNDKYIDELKNDDEEYDDVFRKMGSMIRELILAYNYVSLYYFSTEIAFDKHEQGRKRLCMAVFLILNYGIIAYDIYQLIRDYSDYLLSSIIIRFIFVPLFAYYNIFTVLYHKAKDKTIRYVNYASIIITILIVFVVIFGFSYNKIYQTKYRIQNLDYFPPLNNITIANKNTLIHPICDLTIFGVSSFDAFGYALSGFDIKRNYTVFDNQMKIFFGEDYSNHISYKIYQLDEFFQFIKFYDSSIDTTIFAFRGYNSGPEIAFQFELFASQYIIPFFEDNTPFLGIVNDYWLSFYTDFFHAFGLRFFENRNLMVKYVKSIREIYNKENYTEQENILFTGINTGGVIAKIVGTLSNRRSISFISFPMEMDFLEHLFQYSQAYMSYVTNVFNVDGIFSHPDSEHTINIGIDTPLFHRSKFCTSGFCEVFSRVDNIYRTFCTMSETCGRGNQFNYYCLNTIGKKNIEIIREGLQETD